VAVIYATHLDQEDRDAGEDGAGEGPLAVSDQGVGFREATEVGKGAVEISNDGLVELQGIFF
jgi:hypothetical protein